MSVIGSNILAGASGQAGYNLTKSLRFRSSASAYLDRTFGTPTSTTTWSLSFWLKRGNLTANAQVFSAGGDFIYFGGGTFLIKAVSGAVLETTQVFRDPSAWYHFFVVADTSNATANNRVRLYVNGTEVTAFSSRTNPSLSAATIFNASSSNNRIGGTGSTEFYDGYLAEINFIDGQALTPSSFGETSTTTGVWIPKKYAGTYGTNGFYLPFTDTTSTSTLGTDFSGNSNTWTVNNISLTSGSTYDSMTDVPTLTSATVANYCVLNPLTTTAGTYSNANLRYVGASSYRRSNATISVSTGKWYWEVTLGNAPFSPRASNSQNNAFGFGLSTVFNSTTNITSVTDAVVLADSGYYKNFSGSFTDGGTAFSSGDTLAVAVDLNLNTFTFYHNNTQITTGTIGGTAGRELVPIIISYDGVYGVMDCNFGQRPFTYTPPANFVALNTFNLPTPTIGATASTQANKYFDINTYTGDGSQTASFTNSGSMQPDLVWSKIRSGTTQGIGVFDSVRGTTGQSLDTSATTAEGTWVGSNASDYGYVSAFNSNGFSVNDGAIATTGGYVNFSGRTYVAWQWRASNATAVTNTAGSISSQVSASTTAGFSIVTYTGTGSNATVGHGLGVAPSMLIVKERSIAARWDVYHASVGATGRLILNDTTGTETTTAPWNDTAPTSSVFTVGTASETNDSGQTFVAYCFAPIAGYSAFGSYTGNGSTDGAFIFTGFRPRYLMIKQSSSAGNGWIIYDTARSTYNVIVNTLRANTSNAEDTYSASDGYNLDILSNGFKLRTTWGGANGSGSTYIYMAFAESPFKFSLGR